MRKPVTLVALAALAIAATACKKSEPAPEATTEAMPSEAAMAPVAAPTLQAGTFEVVGADGKTIGKTTINADGSYRDVPAKGLPVAGIAKMVDGKTCFDPSGDKGPTCYTDGAPGADGTFTATADDGTVLTVKPVAK